MTRPHVLVVGGGFGGLATTQALRRANVDITLVDRCNHHLFQPLLYQVATDILDPETVGHPVREYVDNQPNLRFVTAKVSGIDIAARNVTFEDWEDQTYDYLVVGLGARANFFGTPGADEHAFPLYTLNHAIRLKNHVLEQFEAAVKAPPPEAPEMMDVVIVGGGPTGVETAGAMADLLYVTMARDAPRYPIGNASITLVEHGDRLLRMFNESMSEYTKEALEERGVTVRLGESVAQIDQGSVTLGSGEVINAPTTVWGAGLTTSPLAASLSDDLQHGRVPVGPLLNLAEHPEVYVAGDLAWAKDARSGEVLPQLGSVALQAGEHIGRTIDRTLRKHKDPEPFHYIDKGSMATIGRGAAVGVIPPGLHLTGRPAFLTWGAVHLALLNGADSKTAALTNWFWTWMRHDRPSRVLIHPDEED